MMYEYVLVRVYPDILMSWYTVPDIHKQFVYLIILMYRLPDIPGVLYVLYKCTVYENVPVLHVSPCDVSRCILFTDTRTLYTDDTRNTLAQLRNFAPRYYHTVI